MSVTLPELRVSVSFLRQAKTLIEAVVDTFRGRDNAAAARLNEIVQRVKDEQEFVEREIGKRSRGKRTEHREAGHGRDYQIQEHPFRTSRCPST